MAILYSKTWGRKIVNDLFQIYPLEMTAVGKVYPGLSFSILISYVCDEDQTKWERYKKVIKYLKEVTVNPDALRQTTQQALSAFKIIIERKLAES